MAITLDTLEVIYNYSTCEPLPLFPHLSSLDVVLYDYRWWKMLPILLKSCPNLKSLTLSFCTPPGKEEGGSILCGFRRRRFLQRNAKIEKPTTGMKLASYSLENSTVLKEFTCFLADFSKEEESVATIVGDHVKTH